MTTLRKQLFPGRHVKTQLLLFCVLGCCIATLLYGFMIYPDAPYKLCEGVQYCGKTGKPQSYEFFQAWKRWEVLLIVCWPFGIMAAVGLKQLRKELTDS